MRVEPYKKWRVKTAITDQLAIVKKKLNRHDSMTAFIEWVLDTYQVNELAGTQRTPLARAGEVVVRERKSEHAKRQSA